MKKPETLSYIAIVLSVIAIVMCTVCCMGCKKHKMAKGPKHRGPHPEMVAHGEHARPDMRHDRKNRPHHDDARPDAPVADTADAAPEAPVAE